jgi:hypothetical protein
MISDRHRATLFFPVVLATLAFAAYIFPSSILARAQLSVSDVAAQIDRLEIDVHRATALRDVKRLQYLYAQFAEYGLWDEMAALFSANAEAIFGDTAVTGRDAIRRYLLANVGKGNDGMAVGSLYTQILQAPVVTLSEDGNVARGRWQELSMLGEFGERASWAGGMQENVYAKENGVWKISRLNYFHQFEGSYEAGWLMVRPRNAFVPYHYTPARAGKPVPDLPANLAKSTPKSAAQAETQLRRIEQRITALNEEDKVRNLQNIYGYYVDRKMWDDVTDLFTADAAYEVAGVGVYRGPAGVRRAMEREGGPINLRSGQVHDHLQLGAIVTIAGNGVEAHARGLELGMLTPRLGEAYWSVSTFENRYVKQDGIWRIREMRIFPKMKSDYYQGWAKTSIVDPPPTADFHADAPSPASTSPQVSQVVPVFDFPNPASGRPIRYPQGVRPVGTERLVTASEMPSGVPIVGDLNARLAQAKRQLEVSKGYDAIENISSTFGYYLDDFKWQEYVENYAVNGMRKKGNGGFFIGRRNIFLVESWGYGPMPPDRDGIRVHTRVQPVIDVAPDAQSAYIRTRMILYFANPRTPGAFNSGMYPNDSAVLEDGIWKFKVGGAIDETYFSSSGYKNGWAKPNTGGRGAARGDSDAEVPPAAASGRGGGAGLASSRLGGKAATESRAQFSAEMAPDFSYREMPYRGQGFVATFPNYRNWPDIKPMWFHYKNPVSSRPPEFYCADILTCDPAVAKR